MTFKSAYNRDMTFAITIPHDQLARFCQQYHIRRVLLFGSVLRDDFGPDSDVDALVEFEPEHIPGWEIVTIQDRLSELLGRPVDLGTPNSLHPHIRERVLASAQVMYEQP